MLRLKTGSTLVSDFNDPILLCDFLRNSKAIDEYTVYEINEKDSSVISITCAREWAFYNLLSMNKLIVQDLQSMHNQLMKLNAQINPPPAPPASAPVVEDAPAAKPV